MCLIVLKPEGADFDPKLLRAAYEHNPHGFGIMYAKDGRVHHQKGLLQFEDALALWEKYKEHKTAIHFRYTTRGKTTEENCHPFQILNVEEHGQDLFMMHNGTMANVPSGDQSDSYNFVKLYLTPLLAKRPDLIHSQEFQDFLTMTVGNNNRLLFMDGNGETVIINKEKGEVMTDCWLSNTYSLQPRRTYPNQAHNRANYTGYYGPHRAHTPYNASTMASSAHTAARPAVDPVTSSAWQPTAAAALLRNERNTGGTPTKQEWDDELELFFPSKSPRRQSASVGSAEIRQEVMESISRATGAGSGNDPVLGDIDLGMVKSIGYNCDIDA